MRILELEAPVSEVAPTDRVLTGYDQQHLAVYLSLLDAEAEGAGWQDVARTTLKLDPIREPERARRTWHSHLARARWVTQSGYRHLLCGDGAL
jgi:hypothetical protein